MRQYSLPHYHITRNVPAYPNQANTNYYLKKLMNVAAGLISGIGLTASIIILTRMM